MIPRVAFTLIGGMNWTGGYNYLRNLLQSLADELPHSLTAVLFVGNDVPESDLAPFMAIRGCELVRDEAFDEAAKPRSLARALLAGRDAGMHAALARHRVDLVFESAVYLGWRLPLPAIAWIPDLQHRLLPHLFGRAAWIRREVGFRAQIASGRAIMCSSEDTQRICERLFPSTRGRVHAVRFANRAPLPRSEADARAVAERHGLPKRFFFMPNQFWVHKNHRLVVAALRRLAACGQPVTVVASGRQFDPRNPEHVPRLLDEVRSNGLADHFLAPGLLPYEDLAPLMQASAALLNPSLFEGWSTTVEEARAAGVPMLLSDIAVHREQAGDEALYFDPRSEASLAHALSEFQPLSAAERERRRHDAVRQAAQRVNRFANDFMQLVDKTLAEWRRS